MCYFNRLTRLARWFADYAEWLQFCWDFVKHPRNDEIALQHFFFLLAAVQEFFLYFICAACNFFLATSACRNFSLKSPTPLPLPLPRELNGRPLIIITNYEGRISYVFCFICTFEFLLKNKSS